MPSTSLRKPTVASSSGTIRGWTNSSIGSLNTFVRRIRPTGSACTARTGPTGMTPRRRVGMLKSSSCSSFSPNDATRNRATALPTGSSMVAAGVPPGRPRSSTRPRPGSPAGTRGWCSSSSTSWAGRRSVSSTATTNSTSARKVSPRNSNQPRDHPMIAETPPMTSVAQPSGVTMATNPMLRTRCHSVRICLRNALRELTIRSVPGWRGRSRSSMLG